MRRMAFFLPRRQSMTFKTADLCDACEAELGKSVRALNTHPQK